jgi:16S rRNA (uracil1498-N3)-methyltransferase
MHKFFICKENIFGENLHITNEDVNHIYRVLRLNKGDIILVSDGEGREYISKIIDISKQTVVCEIVETYDNLSEPPVKITLYQGLPKAQKMELIIQKGVEIGVCRIQPIITQRVVVKTEGKDISNKLERWRKISEEAAKQSNRGVIPEVLEPITFDEAIEEFKNLDLSIVPYEKEKSNGLKRILLDNSSAKNIGIIIGPEGGFDEFEIEKCIKNGIIPVTLGPRILRTETAGIAVSSMILYELGDMGGLK